MEIYFKSDNHYMLLRGILTAGNDSFSYYEVVAIEVNGDWDNWTVEVFYLERFRHFFNAVEALERKGVTCYDEISVSPLVREYFRESCV